MTPSITAAYMLGIYPLLPLVPVDTPASGSQGWKSHRSDSAVPSAPRDDSIQPRAPHKAARRASASVPRDSHSWLAATASDPASSASSVSTGHAVMHGRSSCLGMDLPPESRPTLPADTASNPASKTSCGRSQRCSIDKLLTEGCSPSGNSAAAGPAAMHGKLQNGKPKSAVPRGQMQLQSMAVPTSSSAGISSAGAQGKVTWGPKPQCGGFTLSHELLSWKDAAAAKEQGYKDMRAEFSYRLDRVRYLGSLGMEAERKYGVSPDAAAAAGRSMSNQTQCGTNGRNPLRQQVPSFKHGHTAEALAAVGTLEHNATAGKPGRRHGPELSGVSHHQPMATDVATAHGRSRRRSSSASPPKAVSQPRMRAAAEARGRSPKPAAAHGRSRHGGRHQSYGSPEATRARSTTRRGSIGGLLPETSRRSGIGTPAGLAGRDVSPEPAIVHGSSRRGSTHLSSVSPEPRSTQSRPCRASGPSAIAQFSPHTTAATAAANGGCDLDSVVTGGKPQAQSRQASSLTASQELLLWKDAAAGAAQSGWDLRKKPPSPSSVMRFNSADTLTLQLAVQSAAYPASEALGRSSFDVSQQSGNKGLPNEHVSLKQQVTSAAALAAVGQNRSSDAISNQPPTAATRDQVSGAAMDLAAPAATNRSINMMAPTSPLRKAKSTPIPANHLPTSRQLGTSKSMKPVSYDSSGSGSNHTGDWSGSGTSDLGYNPYIPQIDRIDERAQRKGGEADCAAYILKLGRTPF